MDTAADPLRPRYGLQAPPAATTARLGRSLPLLHTINITSVALEGMTLDTDADAEAERVSRVAEPLVLSDDALLLV